MSRLEKIRGRHKKCGFSCDENWLVTEVDRLRAVVKRWTGLAQSSHDSSEKAWAEVTRVTKNLRRVVEALDRASISWASWTPETQQLVDEALASAKDHSITPHDYPHDHQDCEVVR